ncbi:NTP transferase domain-containing protein [Phycicoccus sp. MAQZ13P-2]|uniref:molybdenum cofactor guanylyltransferase n=1 Tax=Phycicoccus mangrovi TaxID=2840470 RepID=UPI001C00461A|nr:NTP transferase domain-containing protein [Phycicoccus mangrovi]MBT9254799.1 NTP transferase domain-containing protein [Phycicoccus mangrovi]MBT9272996.1 NTP transferase domain-containing protein [Phycicoccus mangrovi]
MTAPGEGVPVVVLAGGSSRRFGSDKLAAPLGGSSVLERAVAGVPTGWPVVLVGPERPLRRPGARWVREDPPGGGPLAAVLAGIAACGGEVVAVLAGDMPAGGAALPSLVDALRPDDAVGAAVAEDDDGRVTPLLAAYRRSAVEGLALGSGHGGRAMALLDAGHVAVRVGRAGARDVDTPRALAQAEADLTEG